MEKLSFTVLVILSAPTFLVQAEVSRECYVRTKVGEVQGTILEARGGGPYCGFFGIPYAEYPGRFQVAKKFAYWANVLYATEVGAPCPQLSSGKDKTVLGAEDCLVLNIFYPIGNQCESMRDERIPVLLHVHGGAYSKRDGAKYGPEYVMADCVVFVSFNYRIGALGFLTTSDSIIPGNIGLKDQVLAMSWVREHVDSFGGDPEEVTLHGYSAGSCAVTNHIVSPLSKGLFQKAIAQSGSVLNPWALVRNPDFWAGRLASALGCREPLSSERIKQCLLGKRVEDIVRKQEEIRIWRSQPSIIFAPVIESKDASDAFLAQNPYDAYEKGEISAVPLMIGVVPNESLIFKDLPLLINPVGTQEMNEDWENIAPIVLDFYAFRLSSSKKEEFGNKIREFYLQGKRFGWESIEEMANMNTDRQVNFGVALNAELHSRYAPTYRYLFNYTGDFSLLSLFNYTRSKLSHADDEQYLLRVPTYFPDFAVGSMDEEFSEKYVKLVLSFVKSGVPFETWPKKHVWKPLYPQTSPHEWLEINEECKMIADYVSDRLEFWKRLGLGFYELGNRSVTLVEN